MTSFSRPLLVLPLLYSRCDLFVQSAPQRGKERDERLCGVTHVVRSMLRNKGMVVSKAIKGTRTKEGEKESYVA